LSAFFSSSFIRVWARLWASPTHPALSIPPTTHVRRPACRRRSGCPTPPTWQGGVAARACHTHATRTHTRTHTHTGHACKTPHTSHTTILFMTQWTCTIQTTPHWGSLVYMLPFTTPPFTFTHTSMRLTNMVLPRGRQRLLPALPNWQFPASWRLDSHCSKPLKRTMLGRHCHRRFPVATKPPACGPPCLSGMTHDASQERLELLQFYLPPTATPSSHALAPHCAWLVSSWEGILDGTPARTRTAHTAHIHPSSFASVSLLTNNA